MILSNFSGNAGNFLHQYALTRTVAELNSYEWGFNPTSEFDYYNGYPQLDFMDIDYGKQHNYTYYEIPEGYSKWEEKCETFYHVDRVDFHSYDPEVFNISDNTKLFIRCAQDARYYDKEKVRKWFKIKEENDAKYKQILDDNHIILDENLTIINARGGEYKGIPNVLLRTEYWKDSVNYTLTRNKDMKFLVVTDDVEYSKSIFPFPVVHFGIGMDYWMINNAKNLILSNSSFAIFPAWLNINNPFVIAPKFWARHNVSNGYWVSSDVWTFGFHFMDREGKLSNGI